VRLRGSLPNFKYEVCLSRPDPTWKGHTGHLTEELVARHMTSLDSPTFFLCGPKGFMDNARQILSTLGVNRDRILQESFGNSQRSTESRPGEVRTVENVVFMRSEKVCQVSAGGCVRKTNENSSCCTKDGGRPSEVAL